MFKYIKRKGEDIIYNSIDYSFDKIDHLLDKMDKKIDLKFERFDSDAEVLDEKLSHTLDKFDAALKRDKYKNEGFQERFKKITEKNKYKTYTDNFTETDYLQKGDIIGISRGHYDHYGVYIGNDKVIHFTSKDSDTSVENEIMLTKMVYFMKGQTYFFKVNLEYFKPNNFRSIATYTLKSSNTLALNNLVGLYSVNNIFSREETVSRAHQLIGQKGYNLLLDNCEHFAWWCKTGKKKMLQKIQFVKIPLKYPDDIT